MFLTLFHFLTRLLTSKHLKLFITYLVERNWTMWKTWFSAPQNTKKKKISWNIKTKCVTEFYLQLGLRVWRIIPVIAWWAHKCQTFTLISIKIMKIDIFFLQGSGYLNTRKSFSIFMFVVMASGKCDHKYLTIVQEFKPPHIQKN